jgi:hypothetical protein
MEKYRDKEARRKYMREYMRKYFEKHRNAINRVARIRRAYKRQMLEQQRSNQ